MSKQGKIFAFTSATIILINEGLGLPFARLATPFLIFAFGLFSLFRILILGKLKIDFLTKLFLIFLILTAISTLLSKNISVSFLYLALFASMFAIFSYINQRKEVLQRSLIYFIFGFSTIFCLFSIINSQESLVVFTNGFQLVYSYFNSHNHLGDFLILSLISCFYILLNRKDQILKGRSLIVVLLIILFLPFFLFSFSRSAYLSLTLTLIIMFTYFVKKHTLNVNPVSLSIFIITIGLSIVFIFSVIQTSAIKNINTFLTTEQNLGQKTLFASRGEFAREAILSTVENPIFGVGPGNFIIASKKYNPIYGRWTESSHNIFLDIASEYGILAVAVFIAILVLILRNSEKNVYFFMAIGLLFNFQTDYTFRIYGLLLLFFVLLALAYKNKYN